MLESQYSVKTPEEVLAGGGWDIRAIQSAGGNRVTFQDTRNRGKWPQYSRLKVPWGGFLFPAFDVNPCYEKTDVFISLAKLKDHLCTGVTLVDQEPLRHGAHLALRRGRAQRELAQLSRARCSITARSRCRPACPRKSASTCR